MLQRSLQYDLRDFVYVEITQQVKMLFNGEIVERKKSNTVPHDAGDPAECPFDLLNAYPIHDVSTWKDLGPKFVLQTFRDSWIAGNLDVDFIRVSFLPSNIQIKGTSRQKRKTQKLIKLPFIILGYVQSV